MTPTVVKALQFAKYQLHLASQELTKGTDHGSWQAVQHSYDALETWAIALLKEGGKNYNKVNFADYPNKIETGYGKPFAQGGVFRTIAELRTPLKHNLIFPNRETVRQVLSDLSLLFTENTKTYLGKAFDTVSLADMLSDPLLRQEIKQAEQDRDNSRLGGAAEHLKVAFDHLLESMRRHQLPVHARHWVELPDQLFAEREATTIIEGSRGREFERLLRNANETYRKLKDRMQLLLLGINMADYARFEYITPEIHYFKGGNRTVFGTAQGTLVQNKENIDFCFSFVLEAALKAQSIHHVEDTWSSYHVRIKCKTPVYAYHDQVWTEVRRLSAGEEVKGAKITSVIEEGRVWWGIEEENEHRYFRFDDGEIVSEIPYG